MVDQRLHPGNFQYRHQYAECDHSLFCHLPRYTLFFSTEWENDLLNVRTYKRLTTSSENLSSCINQISDNPCEPQSLKCEMGTATLPTQQHHPPVRVL